jgi:hypothetical protein
LNVSPIAKTLGRVTQQLRKVAERLENAQGAVSRLVLDSASPRSTHFHDLQELDRATQEIGAIAAFLDRLAADVPGEWLTDAKRASLSVDLHALAAILGDGEADMDGARETAAHEYEIFD